MNMRLFLDTAAKSKTKHALPILSFPAAQKLNVSIDELVKGSNLQADAMEIVASKTDTIAAVSLMDLSVEAEAFGANVRFSKDEVPAVIGQLITDENEAKVLKVPALDKGRAGVCIEGVRLAKQRILDKPVFAGMIGPFSLAGRLMDVTEIMYMCYDEPQTVHIVLEKASEYLINYGRALKLVGADGIILAEPLAGVLSPDMAIEFSVPYVKQIVKELKSDEFAIIYHNCGNAVVSMLDDIFSQDASAYHFGNAIDMQKVMSATPDDIICMGNIDPVSEFVKGTPQSMRKAVKELLNKCGGQNNFILSSGCDIPFNASWDNIAAFFSALND